jgi:hypothetical protein
MSHGYEATILADSISPAGVRLTTFKTVYPRMIHSEMLRHRMFSHSVASSRAIPPEKMMREIEGYDFIPNFNKRVKGMGVGDPLESWEANVARSAWLDSRDVALKSARQLIELNVDKSRINRLLEPFMWVTDIITATEWSNFFALRQPSGNGPVPDQNFPAQPEFQIIARMMRDAMDKSQPESLLEGEWHTPLAPGIDSSDDAEIRAKISAGRCARASFDKQDEQESSQTSLNRCEFLINSGHWSPMEHVARPITHDDIWNPDFRGKLIIEWDETKQNTFWCGHLRWWICLRKFYENEHDRSLMLDQNPELERL